jgi:hypothetical protein
VDQFKIAEFNHIYFGSLFDLRNPEWELYPLIEGFIDIDCLKLPVREPRFVNFAKISSSSSDRVSDFDFVSMIKFDNKSV